MRLLEFYYPEDDKASVIDYDDSRRPRLTLKHLNRLRRNKDISAEEKQSYLQFLPSMYGASEE
jgi:hypothetical protein